MSGKNIVIHESIHELIKHDVAFLGRSGMNVVPIRTNLQALEFHRADKADLIITNLDEPDMPGDSLCSAIRNDPELRDVSIIIVCSDSDEDARRCLECGANTCVARPLNGAVLLQEAYHLLQIAPRRTCRVPIRIRISATSGEKRITGEVENISSSGMLIKSDALLGEGDEITCSFSLPDHGHISISAEIVRVVEHETEKNMFLFGVTFTSQPRKVISAISAFVDEHCQDLVEGMA
jgi:CheY-like chemotaxis protein